MDDLEIEKLLKLSNKELKDELKKYSPEKRIEILERLEKAREKEQEERDAIKRETIEEITLEEKFEESPPEEQQLQRPDSAEEENLETQVRKTPAEELDYGQSFYKVTGLYNELRDIVEGENRNNNDIYRAGEIYNEILQTENYQPQEELKDIAYGSRKLMKDLMGDYISQTYKD